MRRSSRVAARKAVDKAFEIAFVPSFVAALVSYLITYEPAVHDSAYIEFGLQMFVLIFKSFVWAGVAWLFVICIAFIHYRWNV
jgi:hypothetical protein